MNEKDLEKLFILTNENMRGEGVATCMDTRKPPI